MKPLIRYESQRKPPDFINENETNENEIDDEFDFGSWNPESIPLLQRTIDQARSFGVKRTVSWMAGTHKEMISEG